MQDPTVIPLGPAYISHEPANDPTHEASRSALSWASIIGGALAITAVTVILLTFGGALGLAPTSPPDNDRMGMTLTALAAIWLIFTQWIASALGGYLTGRLRTRWVQVHTHEIFFRDTVHGLLAWATAMILGALAISSALSHLAGQHMAGPGAPPAPEAYYVDSLYRTMPQPATPETPPTGEAPIAQPATPAVRVSPELRAETSHILMMDMRRSAISDSDRAYLAQLVATQTGLSSSDSATRVDDVLTQIKADAQTMRKTLSLFSLFTGLSMLIGAFIAAAAAAFGGSQRDEWEHAVRTGTYKG